MQNGWVVTEEIITMIENEKCTTRDTCFVRWTDTDTDSGMGIVEVESLSGYDIDCNQLKESYMNQGLKRVERDGRKVVTYWDQVHILIII